MLKHILHIPLPEMQMSLGLSCILEIKFDVSSESAKSMRGLGLA